MLDIAENRPIVGDGRRRRKDEIGEMARAVEVFRENAAERVQLEEETAPSRPRAPRGRPRSTR